MTEISEGSSAASTVLRTTLINNAAIVLSATGAFLTFAGISYYETLFAQFALKPSLLESDRAVVLVRGFWTTLYAIVKVISEHLWMVLLEFALVGLLVIATIFAAKRWTFIARFGQAIRPWSDRIAVYDSRILKWSIVLVAALTGLLAGHHGGRYDAQAIQDHRANARSCYIVSGIPHRGILLAQDRERSILVKDDVILLINNDELSSVRACGPLRVKPASPS